MNVRLLPGAGFSEMDAVLRELKRGTAKGVARRAMRFALKPVADAAASAAPSPREAAAIEISGRLSKNQARSNPDRDTDTVINLFVGSNSKLSHLFEFGTAERRHKSGKSTGAMAPRPFMRPAWDGNTGQVLDRLRDQLRIEIEKTLARAARKAARGG